MKKAERERRTVAFSLFPFFSLSWNGRKRSLLNERRFRLVFQSCDFAARGISARVDHAREEPSEGLRELLTSELLGAGHLVRRERHSARRLWRSSGRARRGRLGQGPVGAFEVRTPNRISESFSKKRIRVSESSHDKKTKVSVSHYRDTLPKSKAHTENGSMNRYCGWGHAAKGTAQGSRARTPRAAWRTVA